MGMLPRSSSGSVTPAIAIGTSLRSGGHRRFGVACAAPHAGAPFTTVTVTSAGALVSTVSVTVSRNVSWVVVGTGGAVKLGVAVFVLVSTTEGPPTCIHVKLIVSPSGSLLLLPSSVTGFNRRTLWGFPAFATGAWFTRSTVTVAWAVALSAPSETITANVSVCEPPTPPGSSGAVKLGVAGFAPASVTVGPPV